MQSKAFNGLVYEICEIYIDEVFDRLRDLNVSVNPRKTELGLEEVE